jgi:hypothetical protein
MPDSSNAFQSKTWPQKDDKGLGYEQDVLAKSEHAHHEGTGDVSCPYSKSTRSAEYVEIGTKHRRRSVNESSAPPFRFIVI